MTVSVTHAKVSLVADGGNTDVVQPSDWNAGHTISGLGTAAEQDVGYFATAAQGALAATAVQPGDLAIDVRTYGALVDGVQVSVTASITSGAAALTATGATFTANDVGKLISVPGAGAASGPLITTILAFTDATHVTLAANAGTTLSSAANTKITYGTDDKDAVQDALTAAKDAYGGKVYFPAGICCLSDTVSETAAAVSFVGAGQEASKIISFMTDADEYVFSITNSSYEQFVIFRDLTIATVANCVTEGIYVEFTTNDATYFQSFPRFGMKDVTMRGATVSSIGWASDGFEKCVTLKNVNRPVIEDVALVGKRSSWIETGIDDTVFGFELIATGSTEAPVQPIFKNVHCEAMDTAVYGTGHWEGLVFDGLHAVHCKTAINLSNSTGYPYVLVVNCHFNCFRDIITLTKFFDVKIANNTIYKWDFTSSSGLVASKAIALDTCSRTTIVNNTFNNLTKDYGSNIQFDAVYLDDCNDCNISDNAWAGITYGVTLDGTSDRCRYEQGIVADVPSFGSPPMEFRVIGSGTANFAERVRLTATHNLYVRTDGSNSNPGNVNSAAGAFLTIQAAIDHVIDRLDLNGKTVDINIAAGTYTGGIILRRLPTGEGTLRITGDTTTPSNVIISTTSADAIFVDRGAKLVVRGLKLQTTTSGNGILAENNALVIMAAGKMEYGACAGAAMKATTGGVITHTNVSFDVTGNQVYMVNAVSGGKVTMFNSTLTLTGTPAWSGACIRSESSSVIFGSMTVSGSGTGSRYYATMNGTIATGSGSGTYIPGNSAGSTDTGGQYN